MNDFRSAPAVRHAVLGILAVAGASEPVSISATFHPSATWGYA